uniref:Uncharacterized protein n=1 Tax=Anopheles albimanus TaxID=7167 RepID=A0A182FWZ7_ANOAL
MNSLHLEAAHPGAPIARNPLKHNINQSG